MPEKEVKLIDANALMEDISESVVFTARGPNSAEIRGAQKIINRIKAAPPIDPESLRPQWHDAETDPPKEPMEYIVMIKGGANATTLLFDGEDWFDEAEDGEQNFYIVTHWMPLPEPPGPYIKTTEDEE